MSERSERRKRPGHSDPSDDLDLDRRSGSPRRVNDRIELRVWIADESEGRLRMCSNLSEGGLYVEDTHPPEAGTELDLAFRLPGEDEPIRTRGEVVSSLDADSAQENLMGFGVAFAKISVADKERLRRYIEQHAG